MRREDALLTFGIVIAVGSAVPAAMGFWVWLGFMTGVMTTLVAAAVANANFE